jgi:hypothetical protein
MPEELPTTDFVVNRLCAARMEAAIKMLEAKLEDLDRRTTSSFGERDRAFMAYQAATEKATQIAVIAVDRRLEAMNEFRTQLKDQAAGFFTRTEHEAYQKVVDADLRLLRESRAELRGKATQSSVTITFVLAAIGVIFGAVSMMLDIFAKVHVAP